MVSALLNGILRRWVPGLYRLGISLLERSRRSCRLPVPLYRLGIALLNRMAKGRLLRLLLHISIYRLRIAGICQI